MIIIGGGDTGADCLGTVHRHGCKSVHQFEIVPRPPDTRTPTNPWPQWSNVFRVSSAHEEGGDREYSINTKRFVGEDGRVSALETVRVEMKVENGRPKFVEIPGTEKTYPADLVLLAMGFVGPERPGLLEQLGVELDPMGNVKSDGDRRTSVDEDLHRRRHDPRPEPDRLGDRRGPARRRVDRRLPDGPVQSSPAARLRQRPAPVRLTALPSDPAGRLMASRPTEVLFRELGRHASTVPSLQAPFQKESRYDVSNRLIRPDGGPRVRHGDRLRRTRQRPSPRTLLESRSARRRRSSRSRTSRVRNARWTSC